jgi:site-specific recombinase XerD
VSKFLRGLDREGLTPRNVNKHRQVLAAFFGYACRADTYGLAVNPVAGTDKRREDPPAALDYFEVHEVEALARLLTRDEFGLPEDYVIANRIGRRLDASAVRRRYEKACAQAGLRPVWLHGLRHAVDSLVARTNDPVFVRDWSVSTRTRCCHECSG